MKTLKLFTLLFFLIIANLQAADLLVETESFQQKGGWVVDQQFMDQMGSPYLLAHGMGVPVEDAKTEIIFPETGTYYIFVRTFNWTSPWCPEKEGPGKFKLKIGENQIDQVLGTLGTSWTWQKAGQIAVTETNIKTTVSLQDMTGFEGRCDAIYFTTEKDFVPPSDIAELEKFRRKKLNLPDKIDPQQFDFVVIGGGVAGICAAISAARLGCKVALIHDRPVLGGNNSSEIRVGLGGHLGLGPYPKLGNLLKEFAPKSTGNAQIAKRYEDEKKWEIVTKEKNITLFSCYHANKIEKEGTKIKSVIAKHIESGNEICVEAPLFSDCTGDGTIGVLAGAEYRMGRESKNEFGESRAPDIADKMTMGASAMWYTTDTKSPQLFPEFDYGIEFNEQNYQDETKGDWEWETGMNYDQIKDFERIRDYGLLAIYSNWSFMKNKLNKYPNHKLEWVAYISGKRESRRLIGDYILKEDDITQYKVYNDGTATTTWTIDLHYPKNEPGITDAFKAGTVHTQIFPYPIPYRCFSSKNIENLFMAGRNISVTHVALGTVRVMRTTAMMGEVVGMAASLCKQYNTTPRGVYESHLNQLKKLMKTGVGTGEKIDSANSGDVATIGIKSNNTLLREGESSILTAIETTEIPQNAAYYEWEYSGGDEISKENKTIEVKFPQEGLYNVTVMMKSNNPDFKDENGNTHNFIISECSSENFIEVSNDKAKMLTLISKGKSIIKTSGGENAEKLTDGICISENENDRWIANKKKNPYIIIDLEKEYPIYGFRIYDCLYKPGASGKNIPNYKIEVSNDNKKYTKVANETNCSNDNIKEFFIKPVSARYVKFTPYSDENIYAKIWEFEIYGIDDMSSSIIHQNNSRISHYCKNDLLHIEGKDIQKIRLLSLQGNEILQKNGAIIDIPIKEIPKGVYLLIITQKNGPLLSEKILIN